MKTFVVHVKEVWVQLVEVQAVSELEALEKVSEGECTCPDNAPEYSHDMPVEHWTVEEVPSECNICSGDGEVDTPDGTEICVCIARV